MRLWCSVEGWPLLKMVKILWWTTTHAYVWKRPWVWKKSITCRLFKWCGSTLYAGMVKATWYWAKLLRIEAWIPVRIPDSAFAPAKKGGAPTVILITDEYHMPRTRRFICLEWYWHRSCVCTHANQLDPFGRPSQQNYDHSRRAIMKMLATVRDMLFWSLVIVGRYHNVQYSF